MANPIISQVDIGDGNVYDLKAGGSDSYRTSDSASTEINDNDYIPMSTNDGSTKKKTLFSTVVSKLLGRKSVKVTPSSSGKSTLLDYINDVVRPMNLSTYSFPAQGFSDLPTDDWGYTVTVNCESSALNIIAYRHLSGCLYYTRDIDASRQWINPWTRLALANESIKNITRSGTTFTATRADNTTFTFTQQDNYCGYSKAIISRNIGTTDGLYDLLPISAGNNLNNITWNSEYNVSEATNAPTANWGFVVTRCHAGSSQWARQDFYDMFTDAVYTRRKTNGLWGEWTHIVSKLDFTYRGNVQGRSINIGTDWYEMILMVRNDDRYVSFDTAHILRQSLPPSGWFYPRLKTAFAEGNVAVNQSTVSENDAVFSSIHVYTR